MARAANRKKYSGKQIVKAGKILAFNESYEHAEITEQMDVLSYWRYCHERPLNEAFSVIQSVVAGYDRDAIYARRLKRSSSIISKLRRFESMSLRNMQDIGGCRAILGSEKKLQQVVRALRKRKEFRDGDGRTRSRDYLSKPKEDGYRSYHLIGKFKDEYGETRSIEVQLRTLIQHYWATALEIVDIFTGQALKSNQGQKEWHTFFRLVGDQFALMDRVHLIHTLTPVRKYQKYVKELSQSQPLIQGCREVQQISRKLEVKNTLQAYAGSLQVIDTRIDVNKKKGYFLLNFDREKRNVTVKAFEQSDAASAEGEYIAAEKEYANTSNNVVALVSTSNIGDIKEAYPNFFADSSYFAEHLELIEKVQLKKGLIERLIESTPKMRQR